MKKNLFFNNNENKFPDKSIDEVNIVSFDPIENRELANEFNKGHADVLKNYGLENISSNEMWINKEGITCYAVIEQ